MADFHREELRLSATQSALFDRCGVDPQTFAHLVAELRAGRFGAARNRLPASDVLEPPRQADILPWTATSSPAARAAGAAALAAGEVAVAILNGGMATRFGGRVKGVVEVAGGLSFLALKLRDVAAAGRCHVFLMNSFATDADTRAHLAAHANFGLPEGHLHLVQQRVAARLTPSGEVFFGADGQPSLYAPGHGDLLAALADDPAFAAFRATGGRLLAISNVDNLGATVHPGVIGAHLLAGRPLTTEVAGREGGDTGGAPVRRNGRLEVLEGFRFPADFAADRLPVFNTNSFVIDAAAVRGDYPLTWFRADKQVGGAPVVQFERLLGEVTSFVESTFLQVPRSGPDGRFLPVKTPQDIEAVRPQVRARFGL